MICATTREEETLVRYRARGLFSEFRLRARHVIAPVIGICMASYFGYHAVQGDRGMIAWNDLRHQLEEARFIAAEVNAHRRSLERQVALLNPKSLDPDMLDERARLMLNVGFGDEIVVFYTP